MAITRYKGLGWVAALLWVLTGVLLVASYRMYGQDLPLDQAGKLADIARQKDVVWLSLVTAICAILFSAWLVRQMLSQWAETIKALTELKEEWAKRPCAFSHQQNRQ